MAYSTDLRVRVIDAYERGVGTPDQLAQLFAVSRRTIYYWLARKRQTGSVERSESYGGRSPKVDEQGREVLVELNREQPDRILPEFCEELRVRTGIEIDPSTMSRTLRRMGLTNKKNSQRHAGQ